MLFEFAAATYYSRQKDRKFGLFEFAAHREKILKQFGYKIIIILLFIVFLMKRSYSDFWLLSSLYQLNSSSIPCAWRER